MSLLIMTDRGVFERSSEYAETASEMSLLIMTDRGVFERSSEYAEGVS